MKTFLLSLLVATSAFAQLVPWTLETSPIASTQAGDPAFLFVPAPLPNGVQLIVGPDSLQLGIYLWVPGQFPQVLPVGMVNSADARGAVLVVSSVSTNTLLVFQVADGGLDSIDNGNLNVPTPGQVALAQNGDGGFEVWVDTSSPTIQHFTMSAVVDGGVTFRALSSITVPETPTGLAVDDRRGRLYVAQPSLGVLAVERSGLSDFVISIDGGHLGAVVGGLDLFLSADGGALLFSTAPTEDELKVHALIGSMATYRTALQIGDTDGGARSRVPRFVDVFEQPVPGFPRGVLVVQDGVTANYKLVSLADVNAVFPLPPPYLPGAVVVSDAGTDGGADAGAVDGGVDAGVSDGGTGGGGGGLSPGPPHSADPMPTCGCTGGPFTILPALLLLWWIRRLRS